MGGIGHIRQHVQRRSQAVGAKEYPCDDDGQKRSAGQRQDIGERRQSRRNRRRIMIPGVIDAAIGAMQRPQTTKGPGRAADRAAEQKW